MAIWINSKWPFIIYQDFWKLAKTFYFCLYNIERKIYKTT